MQAFDTERITAAQAREILRRATAVVMPPRGRALPRRSAADAADARRAAVAAEEAAGSGDDSDREGDADGDSSPAAVPAPAAAAAGSAAGGAAAPLVGLVGRVLAAGGLLQPAPAAGPPGGHGAPPPAAAVMAGAPAAPPPVPAPGAAPAGAGVGGGLPPAPVLAGAPPAAGGGAGAPRGRGAGGVPRPAVGGAAARPPARRDRWLDDDDGDHARGRARRYRRDASPDDDDRARTPSPASRLANWDFPREMLRALDDAGGVSCHHYVASLRFRDNRARNECQQLALFIDSYLAMVVGGEGLPLDSDLLDLLSRRLIGVLNADEHGNWSLATASQRSGVSRMAGNDLLTQMSRAANAHDRLQKAVVKTTTGGSQYTGKKPRGKRGSGKGAGGKPESDAAARGAAAPK